MLDKAKKGVKFKMEKQKNEKIIIIILLALAFAVRIWGIGFGLPEIYSTDEWFEVKRALKLGALSFDFDRVAKGWFYYLLFFEYGIYYGLLKIFGTVKNSGEFLFKILYDPTEIWLLGRVSSAIIGTINCYLIYKIGKTLKNRVAGIFGALFLVFNLIHVQSSHIISVDIPLVFFISIAILMLAKEGEKLKNSHYTVLGIVMAFATMSKISALAFFPPLILYLYLENKTKLRFIENINKVFIFLISFIVCYLVGNPGIIFTFKKIFLWGTTFLVPGTGSSTPEFPISYFNSKFSFYIKTLLPAKSLLTLFFIFPGIFWFHKNYRNKNIIFLMYLILHFLFLSFSKSEEHVYARYLMPILPIICLYFGVGFAYVAEIYGRYKIKESFIYFLAICSLFPSAADSLKHDYRLNLKDTRDIGKEWVFKNISKDDTIAIEGTGYATSNSTIQLKLNPEFFEKYFLSGESSGENKDTFYKTILKVNSSQKNFRLIFTSKEEELKWAIEKDIVDYVIIRKKTMDTFKFEGNRKNFPEFYSLIREIENKKFQIIERFEPTKKITGPEIYIYKRLR